MIPRRSSGYCPLYTEQSQYRSSFVVQFRPETNIAEGRCEGRVEHIASTRAIRFHALDELLDLINRVLTEVDNKGET